MKEGWTLGTIEQICNVEYGTRVVKKRDAGSIYPTYGGGGATFFMDSYNRENKLIIARFGISEECTRFIRGKFFLNDSGLTISPKEGMNLYEPFLNYQILAKNDVIYSYGRGAAQKNLNVDVFKTHKISYPIDVSEQKRIVEKLDEYFESIDKAKGNVEKNLQNAKDLFQSQLNQIFSQKGDGWVEKTLGDVCEVFNGHAFKSKDTVPSSDTQLLRMGNLYHNRLDLSRKPVYYPDTFVSEYSEYVLFPGDLVMSLTGTVDKTDYGYTVEVSQTDKNLLLNQRIMKILVKDELILAKSFLHRYLLSQGFLDKLYKTARGTRQANLSSKTILTLDIPFPKLIDSQFTIVKKVSGLEEKMLVLQSNYQQELDALDELKKSILQKAFNGEL